MSHEILYTSAPRLLKPGMTGYGTVVSTRGISSPLADKLESLSGYRWAFEQGDPQARLNPVCHSHVVITVAGQKYHVLSRVADYGADYSGRSNKIAHHVALSESELTPGGPGWVLKSPGFCETRWDEQLKVIDAGRQPTRAVRDSADYSAWKRVTGDAGWAGGLAETVGSTDRRAVHVIFPLGTDTLGLVEESLNLLPHRDRWNVSFSTYYNVLPASVDCHWRFVLDGTPEATNLRRQPHQRIIDLCRPLGPAIGGELVQRARDGWQPAFGPPSHVPSKSPVQPQSVAAVPQPRRGAPAASPNRVDADVPEPTGLVYTPPVPSRYAASNSEPRQSVPSGWRLPLWGTLLLCLLIGAGTGGAGFWLGLRYAKQHYKSVAEPLVSLATHDTKVDRVEMKSDRAQSTPRTEKPPADSRTSVEVPSQKPTEGSSPEQGRALPQTHSPPNTAEMHKPGQQTDDHRSHGGTNDQMSQSDGDESVDSEELDVPGPDYNNMEKMHLIAKDIQNFSPALFGSTALLGAGKDFRIEKGSNNDWKVMSPEGNAPLAILKHTPNGVTLQWSNIADGKYPVILRKCLIQLEPDKNPVRLSKAVAIAAPSLLPTERGESLDLSDTPDLKETLPNATVGAWRFNGMPDKSYSIQEGGEVFSPAQPKKTFTKLAITNGSQEKIAELRIKYQPKESNIMRTLLEVQLWALMPTDDPEKADEEFWLEKVRNNKDGKYDKFSKTYLATTRDTLKKTIGDARMSLEFANLRWDDKGVHMDKGVELAANLAATCSVEPAKSDNNYSGIREMLRTQSVNRDKSKLVKDITNSINILGESLALVERKIEWRDSMDEMTGLLESESSFSFDVWYDCPIPEDETITVILGTVTTKLSAQNLPPDPTAKDDK